MPAVSEDQRRAAAIALRAKETGNTSHLRGASRQMFKSMTKQQLADFARKSDEEGKK